MEDEQVDGQCESDIPKVNFTFKKFNAAEVQLNSIIAYPLRKLRWSPVGLFRFSALTFNGHKIHYDESWTQSVESHPTQVVHGPLNLISMLDYWRDVIGKGDAGEISYRAMSPLYAGDSYQIRTSNSVGEEDSSPWEILVEKDGKTCMTGTITKKS